MVVGFELRWGQVAERLHQPMVIEPGDPFQRCQLDSLLRFPWPASMDDS